MLILPFNILCVQDSMACSIDSVSFLRKDHTMIRKEWNKLFQNKIIIFVLIAILLIPAIYTTLFLGSMWDPYGKTGNLPVAVVNQDKSTTYQGKKLDVGDQLVKRLKKNDSLDFHFVTEQQAELGLQNGDYYMAIRIPENFSSNAATLLDQNPKKMHLYYYTNPGKNYIASKMSESAMEKLKNSVSRTVTKTYADAMKDVIGDAGSQISQAADGSGQLTNGLQKLNNGGKALSKGLRTAAAGTLSLKKGTGRLASGIQQYTDGAATAKNGSDTLSSGAAALSSGASRLNNGTAAYTRGVASYVNGVGTYTAGARKLYLGAQKLSGLENLGQVSSAVSTLSDNINGSGSTTLQAGADSLESGLKTISDQVRALKGSATEENLKTLSSAIGNARTIVSRSQTGIQQSAEGLGQISRTLNTLPATLDRMISGMETAAEQSAGRQISAVSSKANDSIRTANSRIKASNAKIDESIRSIRQTDGLSESEKEILVKKLESAKQDSVEEVSASSASVDLSALAAKYKSSLQTAVSDLNTAQKQLNTVSSSLSDASGYLSKISAGLANASIDSDSINRLSAALDTAYAGSQKLSAGVTWVGSAVDQLETATASFPEAAAGMKQMRSGLAALTSNNVKLQTAGNTLISSGKTLTDGTASAVSGARKLASGSKQLSTGLATLVSNSAALNSGAGQLASGTAQLASGSRKLSDGSSQLNTGLASAYSGSAKLSSGLSKGADTVQDLHFTGKTTGMFASPVTGSESQITSVPNNGHAMAAYMMNVGLWIACIAFSIMYPILDYEGKLHSGLGWWASKASVFYPLSILMAPLMVLILHQVLGFQPASMGKTILVAIAASLAYMSIMYFFNALLGKVGSFLMLIFTVVQLAASAGTYPLELSGRYVSLVHRWVPFSYAVDAFRSTIAGGTSIQFDVARLLLYAVGFAAATILLFSARSVRIKQNKPVLSDFIKSMGL